MTNGLPSPPDSRQPTPAVEQASSEDLAHRLDQLLEQYLELLDDYTRLRTALSKQLSDGFFALANAQRTSNLGSGRRYGRDGYDGRMKAIRRVSIQSDMPENTSLRTQYPGDELTFIKYVGSQFRVSKVECQREGEESIVAIAEKEKHDGLDKEDDEVADTQDVKDRSKTNAALRDPLSWYGVLVPQSLRRTQSDFITTVESTLPELATVVSDMSTLEQQIWEVRRLLGIEDQYTKPTKLMHTTATELHSPIDELLAKAKIST